MFKQWFFDERKIVGGRVAEVDFETMLKKRLLQITRSFSLMLHLNEFYHSKSRLLTQTHLGTMFSKFLLLHCYFPLKKNVCFLRTRFFKVLMKTMESRSRNAYRLIWWAPFCTNKCKSFSKTNVNFPRTIVSELRNVFKILQ